jgi:Ulp1 family protease
VTLFEAIDQFMGRKHNITPPLILSTSDDGPMLVAPNSVSATPTPKTPSDDASIFADSPVDEHCTGKKGRKTENQKQTDRIIAVLEEKMDADKEREIKEDERYEREEKRAEREEQRAERQEERDDQLLGTLQAITKLLELKLSQ